MKKLPSLKQLQHLVALYEHQHFGKAAIACHISQSTLSASIANLEEAFNAQLIERDHRTFIFTPIGYQVVEKSREIIRLAMDQFEYVTNTNTPMQGQVVLGCIPTIAPFIISDLVEAVVEQYPKLEILMKEQTTENSLQDLKKGNIDVLLLALPYDVSDFHVRKLCRDPFKLVVHKALQDQFKKDMSLWPSGSIFLLEEEHCLSRHAVNACHLKDKRLIHSFHATSLYTMVQMVNSKMGVTFLPELAISSGILENSNCITDTPTPATAHRDIGLIWRKTSSRQATYQKLSDVLETVLQSKFSQA